MQRKFKEDNKLLILPILVLGFIPLITHVFYYDSGLSQFDWFPNNADQMSDYFLAWKMIAIILAGVVMTITLVVKYYHKTNQIKLENSYYALFIYVVFVAMSALFSNYKYWVNRGTHQMFESVWVLFAYVIFCCYTYLCVQTRVQVKYMLKFAGIGSFIIMLIGVLQLLGFDLFNTTFVRLLVTNPSTWANKSEFEVLVAKHTVYTTLYNQNYLSFYFGIAIPLILGLFMASQKRGTRILLLLVEIMAILCMIGAKSSSGWMALCIAFVFTVLILLSRKKKTFISGTIIVGIMAILGILCCFFTPIGNKVSAMFIGTMNYPALKAIDTTGDCIQMNINGHILRVDYSYNEETGQVVVHTLDENGNTLQTESLPEDPTSVMLVDDKYLNCMITTVMYGDKLGVQITTDGHSWIFTQNNENRYVLINQAGKEEIYKSAKFSTLFRDDALSGRGHIWDGIVPILKKYIFIGNGANTFMFAYPQNDYIYREYMNMQNVLDVKAHNMYLQQWIENGLIAMISFIVFCLWYVISSVRIYRRAKLTDQFVWIGIGIFTGIVCYLIVGLANDSNVCTAPVFWIILGLGMAINRIIKKDTLCESVQA